MALQSIAVLVAEHRQVERVLAELEGLLDDFLTTAEVPDASKQALGDIADFLARDLALHIKKENDGLFPALERFLLREAGPLAVMRDEHQDITRSYQGFSDGVSNLDQHPASGGPAAARIRDHGRALLRELRTHLFKEERVLFPFAEGHLSEEDDRRMVEKFEEIVANPSPYEHLPQRA